MSGASGEYSWTGPGAASTALGTAGIIVLVCGAVFAAFKLGFRDADYSWHWASCCGLIGGAMVWGAVAGFTKRLRISRGIVQFKPGFFSEETVWPRADLHGVIMGRQSPASDEAPRWSLTLSRRNGKELLSLHASLKDLRETAEAVARLLSLPLAYDSTAGFGPQASVPIDPRDLDLPHHLRLEKYRSLRFPKIERRADSPVVVERAGDGIILSWRPMTATLLGVIGLGLGVFLAVMIFEGHGHAVWRHFGAAAAAAAGLLGLGGLLRQRLAAGPDGLRCTVSWAGVPLSEGFVPAGELEEIGLTPAGFGASAELHFVSDRRVIDCWLPPGLGPDAAWIARELQGALGGRAVRPWD